ncbi:MAG: hypothetical protein IT384_01600 [Deltaproteobacteria bacterium]|nr:hypothetical protein [Deltaproteobacteria bacterium]
MGRIDAPHEGGFPAVDAQSWDGDQPSDSSDAELRDSEVTDAPTPDTGLCTSTAETQILACGLLGPRTLALDPSWVYFSTQGPKAGIKRLSRQGGSVTDVFAADPSILCWREGHLYFIEGQEVFSWDLGRGQRSTVATFEPGRVLGIGQGLAVSAAGLFWTASEVGEVRGRLNGATNAIVLARTSTHPTTMAASDLAVYWTDEWPEGGVWRLSLTSSSARAAPLVLGQIAPRWIAVAGPWLFWTALACIPPSDCGSEIHRLNLATGRHDIVESTAQGRPFGLAADDDHLYWLTRDALWRRTMSSSVSEPVVQGLVLNPTADGGEYHGIEAASDGVYLTDPQAIIDVVQPTGRILRFSGR